MGLRGRAPPRRVSRSKSTTCAFVLSRIVPSFADRRKNIFNQIQKRRLHCDAKERILMKYEKPKPNTALRRTRRRIHGSSENPDTRTHGYVDAHPALRSR